MLRKDLSPWTKICGLKQPSQAVEIARLGADAIGFICIESSPRYVTPSAIRTVSEALMAASFDAVERVGVFANASIAVIREAVEVGRLTALQLHGQEPPEACARVGAAFPGLIVIKAFRIRAAADLATIAPYEAAVDRLLLDAYHPHLLGGTGETLNWQSLQAFQPDKPWILAGGLNADNVQTALSLLSPWGLDLSSGVEASPGDKSLTKVQHLFESLSSAVGNPKALPSSP